MKAQAGREVRDRWGAAEVWACFSEEGKKSTRR